MNTNAFMDTIKIVDLEVHYRVGVPEEERAVPQRLLITIEMGHEFADAARTDDISNTIDYHSVSRRLLGFSEGRSWKLIETLASDIADLIKGEFGVRTVSVEIKKFVLPEAAYVAVRLSR